MATATKKSTKKAAPKAGAKRGAPKGPREPIVVPSKATFDTDDKRAQYARLAVFNFAKSNKSKVSVPKDVDVNSVSNSILSQAGVELAGGTLLKGPDGLELISSLTRAGATDPKVKERGLTKAYAAEVRPFLRRLKLAESFGRRAKPKAESEKAEEATE